MPTHNVVVSTAGSKEEAERIARALLDENLAACVQLLPIDSLYTWEGEVTRSEEILMLIKSRSDLYPALEEKIRSIHSYETPEILQLAVEAGLPAYLAWIDSVT